MRAFRLRLYGHALNNAHSAACADIRPTFMMLGLICFGSGGSR
jgi:hypothetical protein